MSWPVRLPSSELLQSPKVECVNCRKPLFSNSQTEDMTARNLTRRPVTREPRKSSSTLQCLEAEISAQPPSQLLEATWSVQEPYVPGDTPRLSCTEDPRLLKLWVLPATAKRHIFGCYVPHSLAKVLSNPMRGVYQLQRDSLSLSLSPHLSV